MKTKEELMRILNESIRRKEGTPLKDFLRGCKAAIEEKYDGSEFKILYDLAHQIGDPIMAEELLKWENGK